MVTICFKFYNLLLLILAFGLVGCNEIKDEGVFKYKITSKLETKLELVMRIENLNNNDWHIDSSIFNLSHMTHNFIVDGRALNLAGIMDLSNSSGMTTKVSAGQYYERKIYLGRYYPSLKAVLSEHEVTFKWSQSPSIYDKPLLLPYPVERVSQKIKLSGNVDLNH